VPSTKAQEAASDQVQTGRVTKKTSPSKAATPAKKASPAKVAKTATPAKKAASAKSSPATVKKAGTPKQVAKSQTQAPDNAAADARSMSNDAYVFAGYVGSKSHNIIEKLETFTSINPGELAVCYGRLLDSKADLDGNVRKTDSERIRELRPIYRKVKKLLRSLVGDGLDECLKNGVSRSAFFRAIRSGLRRAGTSQDGDVPRDSFPMIRLQDAVGPRQYPADFDPEIVGTDEFIRKLREDRAKRVAAGRVTKPSGRRAVSRSKSPTKDFEQYLNERDEYIKEFREQRAARVVAGRVTKPSSRAASRSKSPAKSPAKRERASSMSRPVRSLSESPAKAPARRVSKSPAPIEARQTRPKSPSKAVDAQPTEANEKRSRSKSPAKAPARRTSKSPAPIANPKTRSKSPAKAATAQTTPAPLEVAKTRSRSPAKATVEDVLEDQSESTGRKKSPAKRAASVSGRSPSPAKKSRAASPAKETPVSTSTRARSKSPIKRASPQKASGAAQPYNRPHPKHSDRGIVISPTNPQMIETLGKPNPFHETLPAPEVWHMRMPPYFPFGETPYMEREISRQIDEDLNRGE
jgi:hypothetical protein